MKIISLDFETANPMPGSACSFGLAVFENGVLKQAAERYLLPHSSRRYFLPDYIRIHGIRPEDVAHAPEFPVYAQTFFRILTGGMVLAHNAAFDFPVLRAMCELYGISAPPVRYFCTCKASRRWWPKLENHKLDTLAGYIGFRFRHHNAKEDAIAAGMVCLAMMKEASCQTPEELAGKLRIQPGLLEGTSIITPCRCLPRRKSQEFP